MIQGIVIREALSALDVVQARELFVEYAAWLDMDLGYQRFDEELAALPGAYARPQGRLLIADADGQAAGCVALRRLEGETSTGEIKRLWVRPPFRHARVGRLLVAHALEAAREAGYRRLVLDTLPRMHAALALYRGFGFREIPAYYASPVGDTVYLGLELG